MRCTERCRGVEEEMFSKKTFLAIDSNGRAVLLHGYLPDKSVVIVPPNSTKQTAICLTENMATKQIPASGFFPPFELNWNGKAAKNYPLHPAIKCLYIIACSSH